MSEENININAPNTSLQPGNETFDPGYLVRENIRNLAPYTTARHEFTGHARVMLDANENAMGSPVNLDADNLHESLNRYPDPLQLELKKRISGKAGLAAHLGTTHIPEIIERPPRDVPFDRHKLFLTNKPNRLCHLGECEHDTL